MLQKRRARLWLADVQVNAAAARHLTVPGRPVPASLSENIRSASPLAARGAER